MVFCREKNNLKRESIYHLTGKCFVLSEGKMLGRNCVEEAGNRSSWFTHCSFTRARCTRPHSHGREGVFVIVIFTVMKSDVRTVLLLSSLIE